MSLKLYLLKYAIIFIACYFLTAQSLSGQTPVANFTSTPLGGCSPLIVQFQDLSTGTPTGWTWDFGNGNTSAKQNPTASYLNPGRYTVTLTVKNANGANTLVRSQFITVYEAPTINFTASRLSGCFPLNVQFTDNSTGGSGNTTAGWFWDFGDGFTSTAQNPQHTYNSAGSYSITLKVTNDKGCSRFVTIPNYITVTPGVSAEFGNTLPVSCQPPASIIFTNTSTGPGNLSYLWDFGDGVTSTDINPQHNYTSIGLFNVTLTVKNDNGCTDTIRKNNLIPVGQFNPSFKKPDTVCVNSPATFTNTSVPVPSSQMWDFGDGTTSTDVNPVKTYTTPGAYTIKLSTTYTSCSDEVTGTIVVADKATPAFTATAVAACNPPFNVNFQNQSTNAVSYLWKFGDGATSTDQNPAHTYGDYGNYTVTLITTNAFGCIDSVKKTAFVKIVKPKITISSLPTQGCIPLTINPSATFTTADPITSYLWDFGDGTAQSNLSNPSHSYVTQGTYTVKIYITTTSGCKDSLIIPGAVRVGNKPSVLFSFSPGPEACASDTIKFTHTSPPADAWNWSFGDGATSTLKDPAHLYRDTGSFTIKLVVANNGCLDSATKTINRIKAPVSDFDFIHSCINRLHFEFQNKSIAGPTGTTTTWQWNFGDNTISNAQDIVHDFPGLGVYKVKLIATTVYGTNDQCIDSVTQDIKVIDENPDFTVNPNPGCKGSPITFTATNINPSNIVKYTWNFGDGTPTVSTSSPLTTHAYANSRSYTVQLITTDIYGCYDTISIDNAIRINGAKANFSAVNPTGCKGLNVTFNDLSTIDGLNAITNWQWNFGDGIIQNYSAPPFQHLYPDTGTYNVKLKITDQAGCSDSLTIPNFVITTDPVPDFTTADTLTCPGATVKFNNTSSAVNYTSVWDFGDGSTSLVNSSTHNYTSPGIYTIKLNITDQYGCSDSVAKSSLIKVDKPIAAFTVSDSITSCPPIFVQFTDSSSYFTSLLWQFGDGGVSTAINPIHNYGLPGTFNASLIATSPGGCTDTAFKTIYVYDTVGSVINYTPLFGCSPQVVNFIASTPGRVSYLWDFGDGNTDTTIAPTTDHIYTTFGDYIPTVIMKDPSGCLIPVSGINTVHITGSKAKFGVSTNIVCDSATVNFIDSTTFNDPVTSWNWNFGDGSVSNLQNPTHFYSTPGIYTVSLNTKTQGGCSDTSTKINIVKVVLSPVVEIIGDSVACVNSSMIQQGIFLRPDTSSVLWSWSFPNGNSSNQQNPAAQTYTIAGNFVIDAIATNSDGCMDMATKNILVNPLPVIDMPGTITLMAGTTITIPATYSPNTTNWDWQPQTGLSCKDCPQPIAGPRFNTTYHVAVVDSNGCRNRGSIDIIVVCKDGNIFIPNTFSPNKDGSNDKFYPRGKGLDRIQVLRIFNRWGEVVFEKANFPVNDASYGWDGTYKGKEPQPGVYVYQVEVYCINGELIKFTGNVALIL